LLDDFRMVAKMRVHYEFIDPSAIDDMKVREDLFRQLYNKVYDLSILRLMKKGVVFPAN
jgi:hypothetical protein